MALVLINKHTKEAVFEIVVLSKFVSSPFFFANFQHSFKKRKHYYDGWGNHFEAGLPALVFLCCKVSEVLGAKFEDISLQSLLFCSVKNAGLSYRCCQGNFDKWFTRHFTRARVLREHQQQSDLFGNAYGKERFPDDALSALSIPQRSLSLLYKKNLVCIRV